MPRDNLPTCVSVTALYAAYQAFMLSRQAMRCTNKTLEHYQYGAGGFVSWLHGQGVSRVDDITAHHVRAYLVCLEGQGLKDTSQHAQARAIKTFLRWLVAEGDLDRSPMDKVKMPRLEQRIPEPFTVEHIQSLLEHCDRKSPRGARNYAIVLTLLDTGLRAAEFLGLTVASVNMTTGITTVIGKGRKQRQVRVGSKARSAILRMLGFRAQVKPSDPLWVAYDTLHEQVEGPLSIGGLQMVLARLGREAGVMPCSPHRFRRTFALWALRNGMDLHSLRLLMGHSDLTVLQRYLALSGEDVERAHLAHSPVDRILSSKGR